MCGIAGVFSQQKQRVYPELLDKMVKVLHHRGPDSTAVHVDDHWGFGFTRLSIIDLAKGDQPFFSADRQVVLVCNGEIFNYKALRQELMAKGYQFTSSCDVEVIIPLYYEYGHRLFEKLVGQFAFALYDLRNQTLLLARDHFGICPLFYTVQQDHLVFASEIKAILEVPFVEKKVNMTGLDQVFSFPGLVSPVTMFKHIYSLQPGQYMTMKDGQCTTHTYWDADFPLTGDYEQQHSEDYYVDGLAERLLKSVNHRLVADVPVGFYLSGGLDSSLIGAMMHAIQPAGTFKSFSVTFPHKENAQIDEAVYQRKMAAHLNSDHHEIAFDWQRISDRLRDAVYHGETPMKETYNTCSMALSGNVRRQGIKVVLSGEGADELFGGYIGYRLDALGNRTGGHSDVMDMLEDEMREKLWGDPSFFYEKNQVDFRSVKQDLYSDTVNNYYHEIDCLESFPINKSRLTGRHRFHQRSYLDLKLRLADHLIADHCDRMCFANSVEGRYPFLDVELFEFIKKIPPAYQLKDLMEKYLLRKVAHQYLPEEITTRQKFGFVAPGSCQLLQNKDEMVMDLLSYDRIKRQGYFNPDTIERLKKIYGREGFRLNVPFDNDLLIVVITFNCLLDVFNIADFS